MACLLGIIASATPASGVECTGGGATLAHFKYETEKTRQQTRAIQGNPPSQAEINESSMQYVNQVEAAIARCRRGENMTIPTDFVSQYCDLGKTVITLPPGAFNTTRGMVVCAKR